MMKRLFSGASCALAAFMLAPAASATCDITQTRCWINGGNCNIEFKNKTGDSGGSDGSSNLNQTSSAQTITVKAKDSSGDKTGNKLNIYAGASSTMNIEKKYKKGFEKIQISSTDLKGVNSSTMSCEEVIAVLEGNGTCKVFHGAVTNSASAIAWYLGYQCDGGNVGGPTDASDR
ncbi:MAG: hypothetical protein AAFV59_09570 [Pseudomonadota bacterium]